MKKKWSSLNLGIAHFVMFYIAILLITPKKTSLYPCVIWFGMFAFSGIIIHFFWRKRIFNGTTSQIPSKYRKTQEMSFLSIFLFLLVCVSFSVLPRVEIIIPILLILITIASIIYTIISHITFIDDKKKTISKRIKLSVKYSWIIVSLISCFLSRSSISILWDIPYEATSSKLTTAIIALLYIFVIYYAVYFIFILFFIFHIKTKGIRMRKYLSYGYNYSISVFVPLFIIGYISFIAFHVKTFVIVKFGFEFAMKYDTRDTFFCNDEYMLLSQHPEARFIFISEGSYRVIIPYHNDFGISRLTCKNKQPFYSLVSIKDKKDIMMATLRDRTARLDNDLRVITSSSIK
ncbi:hypothetical protein HJY76_003701 [Escherichia coli]|nr:hypothetical protein [Escherichia coli]